MVICELDLFSVDLKCLIINCLIIFQNVDIASKSKALAEGSIQELKEMRENWDLRLIIYFHISSPRNSWV